jgi:hypothetical protein
MRALGRELLLLAGQRTRITWQLSFTDFPGRTALVKSAALNSTPPLPMVRRPRRRGLYALPAVPALLALLVLGAWQSGRLEPLRGRFAPLRRDAAAWIAVARERLVELGTGSVTVEPVRRDLPVRTLALEPAPENLADTASASVPTTIASIPTTIAAPPADTELGLVTSRSSEAQADAPLEPASNATALAVSEALRGTPPRVRSAPPRRATKSSKTNKVKQPAVPTAPLELGTNNAPIFD